MINPNFVIVGVILQVVGSYSYLVDTLKGKVKPNRVSWLLWSIAPLVAFAAEISRGVGIQSLTTFVVGFVPLIIFIASFVNKKSEWQLTRFDIICGALSTLGIILWFITKDANIAILFAVLADGLAALPTIVKSYEYPESENSTIFLFGAVNAAIGLLAIQIWNFEHFAFPLYLLVVNSVLVLLIKYKFGKSKFLLPLDSYIREIYGKRNRI
ncbi:hypothetical protein A2803_02680 [Candidatus Woesebacteria bacterium RIFCSPHIGHO2_01_FULL_44_21]|uniref:Uncharacterized protein n=1 Tax=Candidatus Woesebacteria bacterium RIFCSPHIGHO2_01_FULL_44_21 TaxID=1802503 RepID=A0A1F7YXK8_9BACT|nr:MAG: hypothetical protein A2803_02680 [Candidatus Woesebacteria bacterium RIFCSPHIGHO2_01_FULL_44_21]OGM69822.1 MAG: hypothetical protein A2897_00565 [Candidatus Woesebacteria bacterium RIFCSPLOWO2_01_FULL_44_24b]